MQRMKKILIFLRKSRKTLENCAKIYYNDMNHNRLL